MAELPKPINSVGGIPQVTTAEATVTSLSKDLIKLREDLESQRKENNNFIYWIIGGVVAVVLVVAVEVIFFHTRSDSGIIDLNNYYFQKIEEVRQDQDNLELRLQKQIDNSKYIKVWSK